MNAQVAGMSMKAMQAKSQADMKKLMAAGKATAPLFITIMTEHHRDAIKMSQDAVKRASDADLKKLAEQMLSTQTKELKELQMHKGQWSRSQHHGQRQHGSRRRGTRQEVAPCYRRLRHVSPQASVATYLPYCFGFTLHFVLQPFSLSV